MANYKLSETGQEVDQLLDDIVNKIDKSEADSKYPILVGGKVPLENLPAFSSGNTFSATNESEMLTEPDVNMGDVCIRTDFTPVQRYILIQEDSSVVDNWHLLDDSDFYLNVDDTTFDGLEYDTVTKTLSVADKTPFYGVYNSTNDFPMGDIGVDHVGMYLVTLNPFNADDAGIYKIYDNGGVVDYQIVRKFAAYSNLLGTFFAISAMPNPTLQENTNKYVVLLENDGVNVSGWYKSDGSSWVFSKGLGSSGSGLPDNEIHGNAIVWDDNLDNGDGTFGGAVWKPVYVLEELSGGTPSSPTNIVPVITTMPSSFLITDDPEVSTITLGGNNCINIVKLGFVDQATQIEYLVNNITYKDSTTVKVILSGFPQASNTYKVRAYNLADEFTETSATIGINYIALDGGVVVVDDISKFSYKDPLMTWNEVDDKLEAFNSPAYPNASLINPWKHTDWIMKCQVNLQHTGFDFMMFGVQSDSENSNANMESPIYLDYSNDRIQFDDSLMTSASVPATKISTSDYFDGEGKIIEIAIVLHNKKVHYFIDQVLVIASKRELTGDLKPAIILHGNDSEISNITIGPYSIPVTDSYTVNSFADVIARGITGVTITNGHVSASHIANLAGRLMMKIPYDVRAGSGKITHEINFESVPTGIVYGFGGFGVFDNDNTNGYQSSVYMSINTNSKITVWNYASSISALGQYDLDTPITDGKVRIELEYEAKLFRMFYEDTLIFEHDVSTAIDERPYTPMIPFVEPDRNFSANDIKTTVHETLVETTIDSASDLEFIGSDVTYTQATGEFTSTDTGTASVENLAKLDPVKFDGEDACMIEFDFELPVSTSMSFYVGHVHNASASTFWSAGVGDRAIDIIMTQGSNASEIRSFGVNQVSWTGDNNQKIKLLKYEDWIVVYVIDKTDGSLVTKHEVPYRGGIQPFFLRLSDSGVIKNLKYFTLNPRYIVRQDDVEVIREHLPPTISELPTGNAVTQANNAVTDSPDNTIFAMGDMLDISKDFRIRFDVEDLVSDDFGCLGICRADLLKSDMDEVTVVSGLDYTTDFEMFVMTANVTDYRVIKGNGSGQIADLTSHTPDSTKNEWVLSWDSEHKAMTVILSPTEDLTEAKVLAVLQLDDISNFHQYRIAQFGGEFRSVSISYGKDEKFTGDLVYDYVGSEMTVDPDNRRAEGDSFVSNSANFARINRDGLSNNWVAAGKFYESVQFIICGDNETSYDPNDAGSDSIEVSKTGAGYRIKSAGVDQASLPTITTDEFLYILNETNKVTVYIGYIGSPNKMEFSKPDNTKNTPGLRIATPLGKIEQLSIDTWYHTDKIFEDVGSDLVLTNNEVSKTSGTNNWGVGGSSSAFVRQNANEYITGDFDVEAKLSTNIGAGAFSGVVLGMTKAINEIGYLPAQIDAYINVFSSATPGNVSVSGFNLSNEIGSANDVSPEIWVKLERRGKTVGTYYKTSVGGTYISLGYIENMSGAIKIINMINEIDVANNIDILGVKIYE